MVNPNRGPLKPSTVWSGGASRTWGAYWDVMFPPGLVTGWVDWKRGSTGVNIARRFWDQREYLLRTYEAVHGIDPDQWPSRHPGVVLDAVPSIDHAACLGCQWLDTGHHAALLAARRHETGSEPAGRHSNRKEQHDVPAD